MRYYYDCEFLEDGKTIELISIGIVAEDGRELYLVNGDAPWPRIEDHEWLMANVVPSLPTFTDHAEGLIPDWAHPAVRERTELAGEVWEFLLAVDKPELWAYYAAYDHVALCQLWGRMIDLPEGIPMYTRDLKQECARLGNPALPKQAAGEHNALADARHNRVMHRFLEEMAANNT